MVNKILWHINNIMFTPTKNLSKYFVLGPCVQKNLAVIKSIMYIYFKLFKHYVISQFFFKFSDTFTMKKKNTTIILYQSYNV